MATRKRKPASLIGDLRGPVQEIKVMGHLLRLDGNHFDVSIVDRWTAYMREYEDYQKPSEAETVLAEIFCDAILPANPEWTAAKLKRMFPSWVRTKVLDHFFAWRLASQPLITVLSTTGLITETPEQTPVHRVG